jgi:N-acetylmuramoyl-L-alanine amidase.
MILVLVSAVASLLAVVSPAGAAPVPRSGEPWLGLGLVHTQTCAPGCDDRVFTLSIQDVDPYSAQGDRSVWDYAPGTPLTLRLEWNSLGGGGMATSANVFFRYFNGGQIGTNIWQPTLSGTSGVRTTTIHLDNNPMDGVYGAPQPGVIFEVYAQLVGNADNGADTRGAPAAGPNGGLGGYARGLFSSAGLGLYDNWNVANGSAWSASKWATNSNGGSRIVDVQSSRGRLHAASDNARANSQNPLIADAEVKFTHEFCTSALPPCTPDRNSGTDLRVMLRATGATGSSSMPNGYRLDIDSGSTTVKVKKVVNGSATTIPNSTFTYDPDGNLAPDPGRHYVRFRVKGSEIKAAMWPANSLEPDSWNVEVTDTAITQAGALSLTHYRAGSGTGRSVYIEDLTLFNLACSGCSNHFQDYAPPSGVPSNNVRVYLSPETNPAKTGCEGYSERDRMRELADLTAKELIKVGYTVRVGLGRDFDEQIETSRAFSSQVHVPIHSNGKTGDPCPADPNLQYGGTLVMFNEGDGTQSNLAKSLFDELHTFLPEAERSPGDRDGFCASQSGTPCPGKNLAELRASGLGQNRAYIEIAYHDWKPDKDWIVSKMANNAIFISRGIDNHLGRPRGA